MDIALSRWLITRHAAHLQTAVEDGKILLWVQLFDADDERQACRKPAGQSFDFGGGA